MTFRNLTSDEVNFMIYRYLQESGFKHSAFSFANESSIQQCQIKGSEVPPGALISFLQKGIQFLEVETKLRNKNSDHSLNYETVFEMLLPDVSRDKLLFSRSNPHTTSTNTQLSASSSASNLQSMTTSSSSNNLHKEESTSALSSSNRTTQGKPSTATGSTSSAASSSTGGRRKNSAASEKASASSRSSNGSSTRPSKKQKPTVDEDSDVVMTPNATTLNVAITSGSTTTASNPQPTTTTGLQPGEEEKLCIPDSHVTKLKGHTHEVFICAWNPSRSNVLASGSGDSTARIWELNPGEIGPRAAPAHPLVLHHGDPNDRDVQAATKDVTTLDWSGDGKRLATGSYDGKARIWTDNGQLKCTLDQHKGPIFSLKWNKAGNYLLSGSVDNTAIVWDVANSSVKQQFSHHTAPTLDVDWRSNTSFATCSTDRMIYVYELGTKDPIRSFAGHEDEVNAIRWSPNGQLLASCSDDFTAKIWSFSQHKCIWDFKEHTKEIYTIKWSPTGPGTDNPNKNVVLASASFDATIKIWDPNVGKCLHTLTRHSDPVYSVAFSPDGKYLASGSFDRYLHIWSVHDGKLIKTYHGSGSIFEVCWNATGDRVAACFSNSLTEEFNVCVLDFRV